MAHHRSALSCLNNTPVAYHSHSLTPSSAHSPVSKMSQPQRTSSQDSADGIRKRVCKACDRCRLKKSKCDGSNPCSRCKSDNAICVFGERKKSHDKVYPKGYVEMLEQQQAQLVSGLQELYRRLSTAEAWEGSPLSLADNGSPLTHDILAALDLLEKKTDGSDEMETFEEDPEKLQHRLISEGASLTQRRGSFSSESEHSQHSHARSQSHGTPQLSRPAVFDQKFAFTNSEPSSPPAQSPAQRARPSYPPQPSPLQQSSPMSNDALWPQPSWEINEFNNYALNDNFALQTPDIDSNMGMTYSQQWTSAAGPDMVMPSFANPNFMAPMSESFTRETFTPAWEAQLQQPAIF